MKTKKGGICLLLFTCMMLLAFVAVVPQRANAEELQTQFEVSDYDEFKAAIATIDEVVSGLGEGEVSPDFVITLKADITLEESTYVKEGTKHIETFIDLPSATRLTIQSPAGSRYAITAYPLTIKYDKAYREPTIRLFRNSPELLNLENIDLKGNVDLVEVSADSNLKMKDIRCEIEKREDYGAPGFLNGYIVSYGSFITCWGTAELENVDFIGDEEAPPQRGPGAFIDIVGTSFSMNNCVFENFLCGGHGAIVSYRAHDLEQQEITLKDCDFKNITFPYGLWGLIGYGSTLGGIGYNKDLDKCITCLTVEGGSFSNCESLIPSAMLLYYTNNVRIKGVEFSGNRSVKQGNSQYGDAGGAVRLNACQDFLFEDCVFTDNYADLSGGALQLFNSTGTIRGGEFKGNTAETHGGAICMLLSSKNNASSAICELTVEDASFVGNVDKCSAETLSNNDHEAPGGGAIFLHMGCRLILNEGTVIKGNQVLNKGHGGGVFASFGAQVDVNGASILDNVADGNGGGIYMDGADHFHGHENFNIQGNDFFDGSRMYFKDGIIAGNTAKNGGGVYLGGKNVVYENTEHEFSLIGAVMRMYGGVITSNHALNRGGGIYLQKGQDVNSPAAGFLMKNGAIYFNEAGTADKPPYNIDPNGAGAEIYNEGENTLLTVRTAEEITAYIQDSASAFVPEKDRKVWFMDWYEDFNATRGAKTRYMLTKVLDRAVYTPVIDDNANQALILDRSTALKVTKTERGDAPANAEYSFELKFTNLPPREEALPVVITDAGGKMTEKEVTPEGGVFNFTLKNGENFKVSGLPAGAKFILTEKDHGSAKKLTASFTNVEESNLNGWTVSGKTRSTWQGSSEATKLSVVELVNDYTEEIVLDEYADGDGDGEVKSADTGDDTHIIGWIAMLIVSALTVIAVFIRRRCQNN